MTRNNDPKLDSFCSHGSLGHNVVLVDRQDQRRAVGKLIAWSDKPDMQVSAARVEGLQPDVSHTRCVVLTKGIDVLFDRLESEDEHTYCFAYHNLGKLSLAEGWKATPVTEPLATTANYENIVDLKRLNGAGPIHLEWDLTDQVRPAKGKSESTVTNPPAALALWQLPLAGGEVYIGSTGMNNPNTLTIPDAAPSVFQRVKGTTAEFVTVLEPYQTEARARALLRGGRDIVIRTADGDEVSLSLDSVVARHGVG